MSKQNKAYKVTITKIERRRNHGMGYEIDVQCPSDIGRTWSWTKWGSKRAAKRLVKEYQQRPEVKTVIDEYTL